MKKQTIKRKGLETFVKSARYLSNIKFVLIGSHLDDSIKYLRSIAPSNVEFTGFVSDEELLKWYQRAKVYCQLSRYEGLPNALCEALSPPELIAFYGQSLILVGARLHSILFALIAGTPSIAIAVSKHKTLGIMQILGLEDSFWIPILNQVILLCL